MDESTARWQRIEAILERALDLEPEDAARFLDVECGDDPALRADVESLLAADRAAPAFLDRPAPDVSRRSDGARGSLEGERLGAFRVLHEIGRGGMSVVHLGERADGQFEQRVAIKILDRHAASPDLLDRFDRERRILAVLDHPGIVRIQDGGVTGDGRPYLVMDHIGGVRIDRHADANRLTIEARLRLFLQVLEAVAFAHRNLVVHRDLKPDNILVTGDDRVRLLDFGIAKLIDAESGPVDTTRTGIHPMTPEYAAPEQVLGEPITTACDVYALGVVLYELLTGHRPYRVDSTSPFAVQRAICESQPEPPSQAVRRTGPGTVPGSGEVTPERVSANRRTEPPRLRNTLDGDLDAIVLKALRKEPGERYVSADAFHDDIQRYLDGLPVLARRGNRLYRARKFVGRHRAGVAMTAGVLAFAALSVSSIVSSRTVAQREAAAARQVTDFLIDVFAGSDPFQTLGDSVTARGLLEQGRASITRDLHDQPVVRAALLAGIGRVYGGLGRFETADTLLGEALDLRVAALGENDPAVLENLLALASNRLEWRDYPGALPHLERAAIIERASRGDPSELRRTRLTYLATVMRETGSPDSALTLLRAALAIDARLGDSSSLPHFNRHLALAQTHRALDEMGEAAAIYEDVLPRMRAAFGQHHPTVATAANNAAFLLTRQGRWADAVPLYAEAAATLAAILGEHDPRTANVLANLAHAHFQAGDPETAIAILHDRLAAQQQAWPGGHWRVGAAHTSLAKALYQSGRVAEAEREFRTAVETYTATIGSDNTWTLVAEVWVVLCLVLQDPGPQNLTLLERGLERLRDAPLDGDTRFDLAQIADELEQAGLASYAARYRALLD